MVEDRHAIATFSADYGLAVDIIVALRNLIVHKRWGTETIHDCWVGVEPLASLYSEDGRVGGHQPTTDRVVNPTATSKQRSVRWGLRHSHHGGGAMPDGFSELRRSEGSVMVVNHVAG